MCKYGVRNKKNCLIKIRGVAGLKSGQVKTLEPDP